MYINTDGQKTQIQRPNAGVFNVRGPPGVCRELPKGPRATPEKMETRRILTKQKYRPYQCCRYRLQRTELETSLVSAMLCRLGTQS